MSLRILALVLLLSFSLGCIDEFCSKAQTRQEKLFCRLVELDEALNGMGVGGGGDDRSPGDRCEEETAGHQEKNECLAKTALETGDEKLCVRINEEMARQKCYADLAVEKGDASLCKISGYNQEKCYMDVAKSTRSPAPCDMIEEEYKKSSCYQELAKETGDESYCANYHGGNWNCYYTLAKQKGD